MSGGSIPPEWDYPPARNVPWIHLDGNSDSMPNVKHSATASFGTPSFNMDSDTMTHNINLSITTRMGSNMKSSIPDGSRLVKYREPDRESFIFDDKKGYSFDPTTGLHYDANSQLFINYEHGILLRWDPLFNTYVRAGNMARSRPSKDPLQESHPSSFNVHNRKARIDRSRSRSPSSSKRQETEQPSSRKVSRGRQSCRSNSRDAGMNDPHTRNSISISPRPARSGRQIGKENSQNDEGSSSKRGGSKRKRDVWNRLGPSSERIISGSTDRSDSERETQLCAGSRRVRLLHTYNKERSRSCDLDSADDVIVEVECNEDLEKEGMDADKAPGITEFKYREIDCAGNGDTCVSPACTQEKDSGTLAETQTQKMRYSNKSSNSLHIHESTTIFTACTPKTNGHNQREKPTKDTHKLSSSEHPKGDSTMKRSRSRELNHSKIIKKEHALVKRVRRSSSREPQRFGWVDGKKSIRKFRRSSSKEAGVHGRRTPVRNYRESRRSQSREARGQNESSVRRSTRDFRRSCSRGARSPCRGSVRRNRESRRSRSRVSRGRRDRSPRFGSSSYREIRRSQSREARGRRDRSRSTGIVRDSYRESRRSWSREAMIHSTGFGRSSYRETRRSCSREARGRKERSPSRGSSRYSNREPRRSLSREAVIHSRGIGRSSYREIRRSQSRGDRSQSRGKVRYRYRESGRSWSRETMIHGGGIERSSCRGIRRSRSREARRRRNASRGSVRYSSRESRRSWSREASIRSCREVRRGARRSLSIETISSYSSVARGYYKRMSSGAQNYSREHSRSFSVSPLRVEEIERRSRSHSSSIELRRGNSRASSKCCRRKRNRSVSHSPSCIKRESQSRSGSMHKKSAIKEPDMSQIGGSSKKPPGSQKAIDTAKDYEPSRKIDECRLFTNSANSQVSTNTSHESITNIESKSIPENRVPNLSEKTPRGNTEVPVLDEGDVLGHLFKNDSQFLTNIILVAPVPLQNHSKNASDALKNQIGDLQGILKVYVNHESTSGSPCSYIMISFKSANAAKHWFDSVGGTVVLNGVDGSKLKAYLHFLKKGNWNCKHCKSFNFFVQSLCSKCYQAKDNAFSPIAISAKPTEWVGIAKLKNCFSSAQNVTDSLPSLSAFNILSTDMISEPDGLPLGLCVFEVENAEEGSKLHDFFLLQRRNAIYVTVNEKPKTPDEEYLSRLFDKMTPSNVLLIALIPQSEVTDMKFELKLIEMYLLILLKEDDMKYENISLHVNKDVGAPYSYVLITFADTETAAKWLKLRRKTFNNFTGQYQSITFHSSNQRSKLSPHFSEDNWECYGCHFLNFSVRSLCHHCFKHREQSRLGLISQSLAATKWLAVPEFSNWAKEDEHIIADFRELFKEFILKQVDVLRDENCQPLPLACVFEMQGQGESLRLREFLDKEERYSVFVVPHKELDGCTDTDPSSAPDVLIVEAPPPECIDLTSEDINQCNEKGAASALETPAVERSPTVTSVSPTRGHERALTAQIDGSSEVAAPVCEEQSPGCIDLTSEANLQPSQPKENAKRTCLAESAAPIIDLAPAGFSVNPMSQGGLTRNTSTKNVLTRNTTLSVVMTQSEVISVCPVPRLGGNTQWLYALALLKYGAEYTSVQYCQGDSFGVPYNYCLVYFTSPETAKKWCTKHRGSIKINKQAFPKIKLKRFKVTKAFLNFSERNWRCDCGKENCWTRSICYNCHRHKGENIAPFIRSLTPTNCIAIKLSKWLALSELSSIFPKTRCNAYGVVNVKKISDPRIRKDKFAMYIFETRSHSGAITLYDYYKQSLVVESISFVVWNDRSAGAIIYRCAPYLPPAIETRGRHASSGAVTNAPILDTPAVTCQQQSVVDQSTSCVVLNEPTADTMILQGPPSSPVESPETGGLTASLGVVTDGTSATLEKPKPDYEAIIWTSFFGFHLNQPPTNTVMIPLCLEYRELPDETRVQIQDSLQEVGVSSESIIFSYKGTVGSPFSYCMISFDALDSAKMWFNKCHDGSVQFEVSRPNDKKIPLKIRDCYSQKGLSSGDISYYIKSRLHYSSPNWLCSCGISNFPLRSVCHSCFKNKVKASSHWVPSATNCVGIKLTEYLETMDTTTLYDVRKLRFNVSKINIGLDPAVPRDPYGIVIFEMETINDGIKFHKFLADMTSGSKISRRQYKVIKNLVVLLNNSSGIIFLK